MIYVFASARHLYCLWYSTSRSSQFRILERGCSFGNRKLEKRRKHSRRSFCCFQGRDWLWLPRRNDRSEREGWGWAACSATLEMRRRREQGEELICSWYVWTPQALTSRMKGLDLSTWNRGWGIGSVRNIDTNPTPGWFSVLGQGHPPRVSRRGRGRGGGSEQVRAVQWRRPGRERCHLPHHPGCGRVLQLVFLTNFLRWSDNFIFTTIPDTFLVPCVFVGLSVLIETWFELKVKDLFPGLKWLLRV